MSLTKKYKAEVFSTYKIYLTQEHNTPFSFFKYIFWNTNIDLESVVGKQILQHELIHINEKHSWDKVYIQLNLFVGWFSPFFWLMKKELEMIHEFIADKKSVPDANTELFAQMLLNTAFAGKNIYLTNPFFFSPIKRRLLMLTKNTRPKFSYLQRIIALPLLALAVVLFSFKVKEDINKPKTAIARAAAFFNIKPAVSVESNNIELGNTTNEKTNITLKNKYKIVVDAGHGGADLGATGIDGKTYEKDIALTLAKMMKEQNTNDNIEIILTRDADVLMNPKDKAEFCNKQKADLFVSLHCNDANTSTTKSSKGTEIYVVSKEKDNGFKSESDKVAVSISSFLSESFTSNGVTSRLVGIWVLQATKCPGVLIEAGFISNKDDLKLLKDADKQKLMIQKIFSGIEYYFSMKESGGDASASIINTNEVVRATDKEMEEYSLNLARCHKDYLNNKIETYDFDQLNEQEKDRMVELNNKMSVKQKESFQVHFAKPIFSTKKETPTEIQLKNWQDSKTFGVWIDDKQVNNAALTKFTTKDFSYFDVSKLGKNAINYGKHYYQINLMTNKYFGEYVEKRKKQKYTIWYRPDFIKR